MDTLKRTNTVKDANNFKKCSILAVYSTYAKSLFDRFRYPYTTIQAMVLKDLNVFLAQNEDYVLLDKDFYTSLDNEIYKSMKTESYANILQNNYNKSLGNISPEKPKTNEEVAYETFTNNYLNEVFNRAEISSKLSYNEEFKTFFKMV